MARFRPRRSMRGLCNAVDGAPRGVPASAAAERTAMPAGCANAAKSLGFGTAACRPYPRTTAACPTVLRSSCGQTIKGLTAETGDQALDLVLHV